MIFNNGLLNQIILWTLFMCLAAFSDGKDSKETIKENPRRPGVLKDIRVSEVPKKRRGNTSNGTAWAIDGQGNWMTAKHVVDSCTRQVFLDIPTKHKYNSATLVNDETHQKTKVAQAQKTHSHPTADMATLSSEKNKNFFGIQTINLSSKPDKKTAYTFGFPGGEPGEAILSFLGESNVISGHTREPIFVWAIEKANSVQKSLAGLSGGPVLSANGNVIGTAIIENQRRGRLYTSKPSTIRAFAKDINISTSAESNFPTSITKNNFAEIAEQLRTSYSVVKVFCLRYS